MRTSFRDRNRTNRAAVCWRQQQNKHSPEEARGWLAKDRLQETVQTWSYEKKGLSSLSDGIGLRSRRKSTSVWGCDRGALGC